MDGWFTVFPTSWDCSESWGLLVGTRQDITWHLSPGITSFHFTLSNFFMLLCVMP